MSSQYDMQQAYEAGGRVLRARMENPTRMQRTEDPAVPDAIKREMGFYISKVTSPPSAQAIVKDGESSLNQSLCEYCRRIFDDRGEVGPVLTTEESGPYYMHWDIPQLERSASDGCALCLLIRRGLSTRDLALVREQALPSRFDYGEFMSDEKIYALRFYYTYIQSNAQGGNAVTLKPVIITLQNEHWLRSLTNCTRTTSSTASTESFSQVRRWIDECDQSHACRKRDAAVTTSFLPTRLIEIGTSSNAGEVRLRDSNDLTGVITYCTLSHCWGSVEMLRLLQSNITDFKERIPTEQLEKTFTEAIDVARTLGVHYLWVDSLCIIQDSEDWQKEAGLMWEVYSNSYLNLSATAASNSREGLFRARNSLTTQPCIVKVCQGHSSLAADTYYCYNETEWERYVNKAPVNTRAWVVQERLLSPRVLHFSEDQYFWECFELQASEGYPHGLPLRYHIENQRELVRSKPASQPSPERFLEIWDSVIQLYTNGKLSVASDKLIAVSGLAQQMYQLLPESTDNVYLAGMWRDDLIYQLLWSTSDRASRCHQNYRAPTWSWASMDGPVIPSLKWEAIGKTGRHQRLLPIATVIDAMTSPLSLTFGPIDNGILCLLGPMLKGRLLFDQDSTDSETDDTLESHTSKLTYTFYKEHGALWIDDLKWEHKPEAIRRSKVGFEFPLEGGTHTGNGRLDEESNLEEKTDIFFFPLTAFHELSRVDGTTVDIASIHGLVLEAIEGGNGQFKRIGVCRFEGHAVVEFLCHLGSQMADELQYEELSPEILTTQSFAFEGWFALSLDFLPTEYAQYIISVV